MIVRGAAAMVALVSLVAAAAAATPAGQALPGTVPRTLGRLADVGPAPADLTLRLRVLEPDRWVTLRASDPALAQPVARLVPVRREAFDAEWLLGQVPIESSRDGADVLRRWRAANA